MTTQPATDPATSVTRSITVDAPIATAFDTFTAGIQTWWPPTHHILQAELKEMVFEPFVGGNIIDRGVDGSECRWARVLAYEPPHRVVFSWDITTSWQVETDPARTSEVEVTFRAEGPDRTHVSLEHRAIDRHGEGWEQMRGAVGSEGGWDLVAFARAAAAAAGL
jgi:uncharacterized protein YndB with AHSA1/START domain